MLEKDRDILLVEDNPADASLLKELFFERSDRINMIWVNDGKQALEYISRSNAFNHINKAPDAIILDLSIPKVSGYEVLKQLKASAEFSKIPIIVLTTSRSQEDEQKCVSSGADIFMPKPYSLLGYEQLCQHLVSDVFPGMVFTKENA